MIGWLAGLGNACFAMVSDLPSYIPTSKKATRHCDSTVFEGLSRQIQNAEQEILHSGLQTRLFSTRNKDTNHHYDETKGHNQTGSEVSDQELAKG